MPHSLPVDPNVAVERLVAMQADIRRLMMEGRGGARDWADVSRSDEADTIYAVDALVEPAIHEHMARWGESTPLVLVAEGVRDEQGNEGPVVFPRGTPPGEALVRVILDPIDGTRGIMYDKRPAWSLGGVAANRGDQTRLRDIFAAAMTELPTSKAGYGDVLTATRGGGAICRRVDLRTGESRPFTPRPSRATTIDHGFATVSNFFPGTKRVAAELMEHIAGELIGEADVTRATVFEDQYISTGGQWYEVIVGHDRFIADLRPSFYRLQGQPEGMSCHPYDCAALLVAEEAGAIITDANGQPLDAPLDLTTGVGWLAYANSALREAIEPLVLRFLGRD